MKKKKKKQIQKKRKKEERNIKNENKTKSVTTAGITLTPLKMDVIQVLSAVHVMYGTQTRCVDGLRSIPASGH